MPRRAKRRRSATPLTVSNVFHSSRLPSSCADLWTWPPLTWYLGDATPADLRYVRDRPFLPSPTPSHSTHPPTHYRLRWLDLDARALVAACAPPPPDTLPTLPSVVPTDNPACARTYAFAETEPVSADQPTTRRRRTASARKPATRSRKRRRLDPSPHLPDHTSRPPVQEPTSPSIAPLSLPASPSQTPTGLDPLSPRCPSPTIPLSATKSHANVSQHHPLASTSHPVQAASPHEDAQGLAEPPLEHQVALQFLAPNESRLMATITYSIPSSQTASNKPHPDLSTMSDSSAPVPSTPHTPAPAHILPPEIAHTPAPIHSPLNPAAQQPFGSSNVTVDHLDVAFRSSDPPAFLISFDNPDDTDEISSEIHRLTSTLDQHAEDSRPLRKLVETRLCNVLSHQDDMAKLRQEECDILARLETIEREKITVAKAAESATPRRRGRPPRQRPSDPRRRRVSRVSDKLVKDEPDEPMAPESESRTTRHGRPIRTRGSRARGRIVVSSPEPQEALEEHCSEPNATDNNECKEEAVRSGQHRDNAVSAVMSLDEPMNQIEGTNSAKVGREQGDSPPKFDHASEGDGMVIDSVGENNDKVEDEMNDDGCKEHGSRVAMTDGSVEMSTNDLLGDDTPTTAENSPHSEAVGSPSSFPDGGDEESKLLPPHCSVFENGEVDSRADGNEVVQASSPISPLQAVTNASVLSLGSKMEIGEDGDSLRGGGGGGHANSEVIGEGSGVAL